jgi:hypothetical protein
VSRVLAGTAPLGGGFGNGVVAFVSVTVGSVSRTDRAAVRRWASESLRLSAEAVPVAVGPGPPEMSGNLAGGGPGRGGGGGAGSTY